MNEGQVRLEYPVESYFLHFLWGGVQMLRFETESTCTLQMADYHRVLPVRYIVRSITAFQRVSTFNLSFADKYLLFLQCWFH
jgi:hypothetical protein